MINVDPISLKTYLLNLKSSIFKKVLKSPGKMSIHKDAFLFILPYYYMRLLVQGHLIFNKITSNALLPL